MRSMLSLASAVVVASPLLAVLPACRVSAGGGVNASVNAQESRVEGESSVTTTPPSSPTPVVAAPPASAPTPPPAPSSPAAPSECPLQCYVAAGGDRVSVTEQELTQIRSALEPVMGRVRSCTSYEAWRDRGSPNIHLRIAPDGTVAQIAVDPEHVYEREGGCMDQAAQGMTPSLSLPGRTTVRCAERCERPKVRAPRTAPAPKPSKKKG